MLRLDTSSKHPKLYVIKTLIRDYWLLVTIIVVVFAALMFVTACSEKGTTLIIPTQDVCAVTTFEPLCSRVVHPELLCIGVGLIHNFDQCRSDCVTFLQATFDESLCNETTCFDGPTRFRCSCDGAACVEIDAYGNEK